MSTKIYTGWRFPNKGNNIADFQKQFNKKCMRHAISLTKKEMEQIREECVLREAEKMKGLRRDTPTKEWLQDKENERFVRLCRVFEEYIRASRAGMKLDNVDCSFNAWLFRSKWYIIPYEPMGLNLEVSDFDIEGMEDYCYWNNVDEPDDISWEDWEKRGRTWDKVCLDDWDKIRFSHVCIEAYMDKGSPIGIHSIEKDILKDSQRLGFGAGYTARFRADKKFGKSQACTYAHLADVPMFESTTSELPFIVDELQERGERVNQNMVMRVKGDKWRALIWGKSE